MSLEGTRLHLVQDLDGANEFMRWLGERHENNAIALDTETTGLDPYAPGAAIRLIQLGDTQHGWSIPWDGWSGLALEALRKWSGTVVYHNLAFEYKWLNTHSSWRPERDKSADCMLGAHIINPIGSGALKHLSAQYVDPRAAAGQSRLDEGMTENGWTWATVPTTFAPYWCVPTDTEVLTRTGWKHHSQVVDGDETLGYQDGLLAWTQIEKTAVFEDAPLVRVGNTRWSTECTPNHRWLYQRPIKSSTGEHLGYGNVEIAPLDQITKRRGNRLVLSGYGVGGDSELTEDEARVVAWLMTDGYIQWQRERSSPIARIFQSAHKYHHEVRNLLRRTGMYVSENITNVNAATGNEHIRFYLQATAVTTLWNRAHLHDLTPVEFVLSLSQSARRAWLDTVVLADGTTRGGKRPTAISPRTEVAKRRGPVHDAIVLAALLEDNMVSVRQHGKNSAVIGFGSKKRPTFQKSYPELIGNGQVWCPTTGLGTWVARDRDGRVFVTGNTYAALDTILTAQLWDKFKDQLLPGKVYGDVFALEMAVRFIVSAMEARGARVDLKYSREKMAELEDYAGTIEVWSKDAFGINIMSPTQLGNKIIELGGELFDFTPTGKPKVDKLTLKILGDPDNGYPAAVQVLADQALKARQARKFASTYFKNFLEKSHSGVIHAEIRTLGARTARMSIGSPALQQLPKSSSLVRNAFIPRDGNVIVTCDSDQIEARLLAEFARDDGLREAFRVADEEGGDFFTQVAKRVYNEPGFVKSDKRRSLVKSVIYALLYGAGVQKMSETAGVPVDRMREVVDALTEEFPGIRRFMSEVESKGVERERKEGEAYVVTPMGRRLPADKGKIYALTNHVIQSTAADVLKRSLVRLDAAGWVDYAILPVHDEVVFDLPREFAEQALHDVPILMSEMDHMVPLTASAEGPWDKWGMKY